MVVTRKLKFSLALFFTAMTALNGYVVWMSRDRLKAGYPDFSIFYTAATIVHRGQGHSLYNNDLQLQVQKEFAPAAYARIDPLPFNHPPFEVVFYYCFAGVNYLISYSLWVFFNFLVVGAVLLALRPYLPTLFQSFPYLPFLGAISFFPVAYALMQGQDSILLLALYCLAYVALRRGRDFQAGLWLGFGLFKFHLVLPFLFVLLLRRRMRTIAGAVLAGLVDLLVSLALVGWKELLYYPRYALEVNRHHAAYFILPEYMANLRGLFLGWHWGRNTSPWLEILLLSTSIGLLIWTAYRWDPGDLRNQDRWNSGLSIALISTFLVGYHGYTHDMSILLISLLLIFERFAKQVPAGRLGWGLIFFTGLMLFNPIYMSLTFRFAHQNLFAFVLIGLAALIAADARDRGIRYGAI